MINNRDKLKKTATDLNIEFPKNIKNERLLKLIEEKQGDQLITEEIITEKEEKEIKDTKVITNNRYNDNELIIAYEIAWNQESSYEILYLFKNNT